MRPPHTFTLCALLLLLPGCLEPEDGSPPVSGPWIQVATGLNYSCGLIEDGSVLCWGSPSYPSMLDAPAGSFVDIHATGGLACALDGEGSAICWAGEWHGPWLDPPTTPFVDIANGYQFGCGLTVDGSVECWGDDTDLKLDAPDGSYVELVVGTHVSCARAADGLVECWGDIHHGATELGPRAPESVEQFSIASNLGCGIMSDETIECWGNTASLSGMGQPPPGIFEAVDLSPAIGCAAGADGAQCWACSEVEEIMGLCDGADGDFVQVSAASFHACALTVGGRLECWGNEGPGATVPPL